MSILKELVNIFKTKDPVYFKKSINWYVLDPKKDITAYELFQLNSMPSIYNRDNKFLTIEQFETKLNDWYNKLPEQTKNHIKITKIDVTDYRIRL